MRAKKKNIYIYIYIYFISCLCLTPIKKLYLSLSHSMPVSLSQITQLSSLSQITLTLCLSFSPKSLNLLSQITQALILSRPRRPSHSLKLSSSRRHSRPSHPKAPNHSPSLLSHWHALNLPYSPPPARPSRPKLPINSPSLSSLTITFRCSIIGNQSVGEDVDSVDSIDA